MKKVLLSLIMCGVFYSGAYAFTETNDVFVASETVNTVTVTSGSWTAIFTQATDVIKSTTVTGVTNLSYRIVNYRVRNNAGSDIDVYTTTDNSKTAANCWFLRDAEVDSYTSYVTRYARLAAAQAGSVTIVIEKNYIRYP